jgi:hypothetical protein
MENNKDSNNIDNHQLDIKSRDDDKYEFVARFYTKTN